MDVVQQAAQILREGGTVVFPTETVYGLGAHALDSQAVARIFEIKRRPRFNPLIVHLPSLEWLPRLAREIPAQARTLIEAFWPGPLTLVLPKQDEVPDLVTAGLPHVALRMPAHPVARKLLAAAGIPIAAPSANRFSRLSPTLLSHSEEQLGQEVDMYLDGGACEVGVESTIIGFFGGRACLLRAGGISVQEIESRIGPLSAPPETGRPLAPGNLPKHYAPQTPLLFCDKPVVFEKNRRVGLLTLKPQTTETAPYTAVCYLSPTGDLREAAQKLFVRLHDLEALKLDLIVARPLPEEGLGPAINDRLRRAGLNS